MLTCNPVTGTCELPLDDTVPVGGNSKQDTLMAVHYVGDPMCSWCWGLSPVLENIRIHCDKNNIDFTVTMGGLRAGGGDPWNDGFKQFLQNEWKHIAAVTGQPFGFSILAQPVFNYDTEPACRAVAVAQEILRQRGELDTSTLTFFAAVQRKFYVEGRDPKETDFYMSVCEEVGLDFDAFKQLFESETGRQATLAHFSRCRAWGVRSFPTLLAEHNRKRHVVATGYVTAAEAVARINKILANQA